MKADTTRAAVISRETEAVNAAPTLERDSVESRLVRGCLNGDEDAWSTLLDRYKRLIYSVPIKYGFSAEEATDIFQEVCVELLTALPRLREPRALPKWLAEVTAHKCARLKTAGDRSKSSTFDDEAIDRVSDNAQLTENVLLQAEREQGVRDAVAALSPRCQHLIQILFFETPPRPYRDVAKELNLASGSIGFIRGRCLTRLRDELRKNGFQ